MVPQVVTGGAAAGDVIRANSLNKRFGSRVALDGVFFSLRQGEVLGGVMLFIFVGMQLSNGVMFLFDKLPVWTGFSPAERNASLVLGAIAVAAVLMAIAARVFARRPL